ncbi:hypothetical protein N7462_000957 [Penicillium macrosclerotiorum]|uniref:uncharacterized protein n=1 Tax=Penicillium macrosclerotiorum TaxID=303699 RepID=UPI002547FE00|nr:uncharacterized protein N7462_000957 [Penicillium macrosclerotiorum]KAJ5698952.1 hypothetical protein N7462_000957 [Penicillium macrosclerotiorum]
MLDVPGRALMDQDFRGTGDVGREDPVKSHQIEWSNEFPDGKVDSAKPLARVKHGDWSTRIASGLGQRLSPA